MEKRTRKLDGIEHNQESKETEREGQRRGEHRKERIGKEIEKIRIEAERGGERRELKEERRGGGKR